MIRALWLALAYPLAYLLCMVEKELKHGEPGEEIEMALSEAEKRQDTDAQSEATWWERKRRDCPRLHQAIDAVYSRLDVELDDVNRQRLQGLAEALAILQRHDIELAEDELAEQLSLINGDL